MKIKLTPKTATGLVVMLVTAVFLAASIVPSTVGAAPWGAKEKMGGMSAKGRHRPALGIWQDFQVVEQLELSQEQVQKLRDADFASREKRLEMKSRLGQLRLEMDRAFSLEVNDEKAVLQLAQKTARIKGQMFVQKIEDRLALETILTSDQIRKLELNSGHRKKDGFGIGQSSGPKGSLAARFDGWECRRVK